jgi:1-hydroxycarotenoid 3,4-desaturase
MVMTVNAGQCVSGGSGEAMGETAGATADKNPVVVIGAGMGGLAAALSLAARGLPVVVLDKETGPGGKMRQLAVGGAMIDAGPTVFTMRQVFEALFAEAGANFADHVTLKPLGTLARHAWADGGRLDLPADPRDAAQAIGAFAGADEARRFQAFAAESARIFALLETSFMQAPRPSMPGLVGNILREGKAGPIGLLALKPFETLWSTLTRSFTDPRLIQLFGRYATYVGSSPFLCPATLMLIAHAEQDGVWSVDGGMHALAKAMAGVAEARGAHFRFGEGAARIVTERGRVSGVVLASGERLAAQAVVFAGDSAALGAGLLGENARRAAPARRPAARSLSAFVTCTLAPTDGFPLIRHNVFFSSDYAREFDELFGQRRAPSEPTVYVCAQDRTDAADDGSAADRDQPHRLLILTNAPADGDRSPMTDTEIARCEANARQSMQRCGLTVREGPRQVTTPAEFDRLFPATGGALYGAASHGSLSPFRRPGSRSTVPGLYLAGGSVHPGAGVPMAATSGRLAAAALLSDLSSTRRFHPVATAGGMPMRSARTGATPSSSSPSSAASSRPTTPAH